MRSLHGLPWAALIGYSQPQASLKDANKCKVQILEIIATNRELAARSVNRNSSLAP